MSRSNSDPTRLTAMGLMVAAMLVLPSIDAIAKWVSGSLPATQIAWSRFAFQTLLMLPLALRVTGHLRIQDLVVHGLRGILLAVTTVLFFQAVAFLPLADAIAIFFVEPLLLTLLAGVFLGERVGWRRVAAVLVGFCGAMIVIRPGFTAFGWAAMLPFGAAGCFAVYLLLTRRLAMVDDPGRMQFLAGVFGLLFMTVVLGVASFTGATGMSPVWPGAWEWVLMALLGVIATVGHLLVVYAFQRAPAVVLAPFQYLEILGATALGLWLFDDFPDAMTWLGIAIIVAAGLYVFHRERVHAGV